MYAVWFAVELSHGTLSRKPAQRLVVDRAGVFPRENLLSRARNLFHADSLNVFGMEVRNASPGPKANVQTPAIKHRIEEFRSDSNICVGKRECTGLYPKAVGDEIHALPRLRNLIP